MTTVQAAGLPQVRSLARFVEQAGAPSHDTWGVPRARDVVEKLIPGLVAKLKISRDDNLDNWNGLHPFIEQLGVASGKLGLRDLSDIGMALFGLSARLSVTRGDGVDLRAEAYAFIERWAMQLPLEVKRKAVLLSTLYAVAQRLPDLR